MLTQVNVDEPKGSFDGEKVSFTVASNDQLVDAEDYQKLILTQKQGVPVKLSARAMPSRASKMIGPAAGSKDDNRAVLVKSYSNRRAQT